LLFPFFFSPLSFTSSLSPIPLFFSVLNVVLSFLFLFFFFFLSLSYFLGAHAVTFIYDGKKLGSQTVTAQELDDY
jgi:hypothetical protein